MYLLVGWCDGFGNDTYVRAVYQTREEAVKHARTEDIDNPDRLIRFDFSEPIDFDYYAAEPIKVKKKKGKHRK